jgi:hypothetical protein
MKNLKYLFAAFMLLLSINSLAMEDDLPLIEGTITSTDHTSMTIVMDTLSYQLNRSTNIFLKGTGQITFLRIKPGMKARLMITSPPSFNDDGMPLLSTIILSDNSDDN